MYLTSTNASFDVLVSNDLDNHRCFGPPKNDWNASPKGNDNDDNGCCPCKLMFGLTKVRVGTGGAGGDVTRPIKNGKRELYGRRKMKDKQFCFIKINLTTTSLTHELRQVPHLCLSFAVSSDQILP